MKSKLTILIVLGLVGTSAWALARPKQPSLTARVFSEPLREISQQVMLMSHEGLLDWKVGDTLNFSMQLKPLPTMGTMTIKVTADTAEGYTLTEDVNVSALKQKIEVVLDKNTGEIKKMTINGKPQQVADAGTTKLVKEEEAHITVPAGSFDCIYLVTEDANQQKSQSWINPAAIPISGLLKTKNEAGGILEINTELVSFVRGN
jgi:hypothetical protein